jgi:hypothetical protein
MPRTFAEAAAVCRSGKTTAADRENVAHMVNRICYLGDGTNRVYCCLALVEEKGAPGLSWVALIMAPEAGDLNNELRPLDKWTTDQQLHACTFRTEFAAIEPEAVETSDADGYTLRGPGKKPAQSSELGGTDEKLCA